MNLIVLKTIFLYIYYKIIRFYLLLVALICSNVCVCELQSLFYQTIPKSLIIGMHMTIVWFNFYAPSTLSMRQSNASARERTLRSWPLSSLASPRCRSTLCRFLDASQRMRGATRGCQSRECGCGPLYSPRIVPRREARHLTSVDRALQCQYITSLLAPEKITSMVSSVYYILNKKHQISL